MPTKLLTLSHLGLFLVMVVSSTVASADVRQTADAVGHEASNVAVKVEKAVKRGAEAAVKGVKRGADATVHGVKRGVRATGRAAATVAHKVNGDSH